DNELILGIVDEFIFHGFPYEVFRAYPAGRAYGRRFGSDMDMTADQAAPAAHGLVLFFLQNSPAKIHAQFESILEIALAGFKPDPQSGHNLHAQGLQAIFDAGYRLPAPSISAKSHGQFIPMSYG